MGNWSIFVETNAVYQCTQKHKYIPPKILIFKFFYESLCILNHVISRSCAITCVVCIFNERGLKFLNNIGMLLIPNHPNSIILITFKGGLDGSVGVMSLSQCLFLMMCSTTLFFYKTLFFHFCCVHVVSCYCCG